MAAWQPDNQLAVGLSHMQTLGYHGKWHPKYVISTIIWCFGPYLGNAHLSGDYNEDKKLYLTKRYILWNCFFYI